MLTNITKMSYIQFLKKFLCMSQSCESITPNLDFFLSRFLCLFFQIFKILFLNIRRLLGLGLKNFISQKIRNFLRVDSFFKVCLAILQHYA